MAVTYRSTSTSGGSSTLGFAKPSPLSDGDTLYCFCINEGGAVPTAPSGWTTVATGTSGTFFAGLFTKHITSAAGEPTSYSFDQHFASDASGIMLAYVGAVEDVHAACHFGASTTTITCDSVTTTVDADAVVLFLGAYATGSGITISTPTGTTSRGFINGNFNPAMRAVDFSQSPAGVTGSKTATVGGSTYETVGITLALKALTATFNVTVSTSVATSASLRRQISKTLSASVATAVSRIRQITKEITTTQANSVSVRRQVNKFLSTSVATHASLTLSRLKNIAISVTVGTSATVRRTIQKVVLASLGSSVTNRRVISKTLAAQQGTSASTRRTISKTLSAAVGTTASVVGEFILRPFGLLATTTRGALSRLSAGLHSRSLDAKSRASLRLTRSQRRANNLETRTRSQTEDGAS